MVNRYSVLLLFFFIGIISCSKEKSVLPNYVAKWNSIEVDSLVFKSQYVRYVSTASVYDSPENREEFSRQLLERRIIAQRASTFGFDTLNSVQNEIFRSKEVALAKYYIRSRINPKVKSPSENEIREAFERSNTQVLLQQIYASGKEQIQNYERLLSENQNKFEELAKQSMVEAGETPETYNMGWVQWNEMDLDPEKTAFSLQTGQISEPVQSLAGWHIFRVANRKETSFADNTTYQNAKEAIAQTIERRRFEEASVQYIDSVLRNTELAMYPKNAALLWDYLSPKLPNNKKEIQQVLIRESNVFNGTELPSDLTLAVLNGEPFSIGDFMKRLPNIPYWQLQPNLRPALETVLKDKLFADKALEEDFEQHPQVQKEIDISKTSALNNVFVSAVSDTLNTDQFARFWYEKRKNNFIKNSQRVIEIYSFKSEDLARSALDQYKTVQDWSEVLDEFTNSFSVSEDTVWSDSNSDHPAFLINLQSDQFGKLLLWGPYEIDQSWGFVRVLSESHNYYSFEESGDKFKSLMNREKRIIARESILKNTGYSSEDVKYNEELLKRLLPFYF